MPLYGPEKDKIYSHHCIVIILKTTTYNLSNNLSNFVNNNNVIFFLGARMIKKNRKYPLKTYYEYMKEILQL